MLLNALTWYYKYNNCIHLPPTRYVDEVFMWLAMPICCDDYILITLLMSFHVCHNFLISSKYFTSSRRSICTRGNLFMLDEQANQKSRQCSEKKCTSMNKKIRVIRCTDHDDTYINKSNEPQKSYFCRSNSHCKDSQSDSCINIPTRKIFIMP